MKVTDTLSGGRAPRPGGVGTAGTPDRRGEPLALSSYHAGLDGLRAVAMAVMLAYHGELPFARGAFLALSQFFTLSGFLITGVLLRSHEQGGIGLRRFWVRRFRRLMPAAFLGLAVVVVFGATVATRVQAEDLPGQVAAAATYTANWYFVVTHQSYIGLFAAPSPVQHYWSLAVEEQFYLFLPVVLVVILARWRSPRVRAGLFAGGALLSTVWMGYLYTAGASLDRLYYGTDTRMAEFLVGGFLAVVLHHREDAFGPRSRRWLAWVGVAAYVLTLWAFTNVHLAGGPIWRGGFLLFSVVTCAVILGVMSRRGPLRLLGWAPLAAMGRITYGLYVYHWPIFLWLTPERTGLSLWPLFAVRLAVTFVLAVTSYHLVEMPFRKGATLPVRGWVRWAVPPLLALALVAATAVTTNRTAADPLATLRADDRSLQAPVAPDDGVMDVLLITDQAGAAVGDRIEQLAADDPATKVVRAAPFSCPQITEGEHPVCTNWQQEWPALIREHDPDLVLLYVDDWPADATFGRSPDQVPDLVTSVLSSGFDLLTARGAPVLWSRSGAGVEEALRWSFRPFAQAMGKLEAERKDLREVLGGRLPDPAQVTEQEFLDRSAAALLADSSLYQRASRDRLPRVMVVGDSQARSLGYGLERWAAEDDRALVWNIAIPGCGLADEGATAGFAGRTPVSEQCVDGMAALPGEVESFDPQVVVVLTSIWDVQDRYHDGWDGARSVGDDAVDAYLHREYGDALDVLTARGAKVVWMNAPCTDYVPVAGQTTDLPAAFDPARVAALNQKVLEPLAAERADVMTLFDLDVALCPNHVFTNTAEGVDGPVRSDGVHFSVNGALWFADRYGEQILHLGGL